MLYLTRFTLLLQFLFASHLAAPFQHDKIDDNIYQAFAVYPPTSTFSSDGSTYSLFPTHASTEKLPDLLPGFAIVVATAPMTPEASTYTSMLPTPTATASATFTRTIRPARVQTTSIETTATPTPTSTPARIVTRTARPVQITSLAFSITTTTSQPITTKRSRILIPVAKPHAVAQQPQRHSVGSNRPGGGKRLGSPLILDINHDGIVSASLGTGISINTDDWFERNGGATNGDKMLAMCDLNKNGVIDGTEVFGDRTQFPLWNKNISKEANGFDSLGDVARSLEKRYPDIKIIEHQKNSSDTFVMLKPLQLALQRFGCDLGFISDDNRDPSKLEPLGDVAGIEINNYVEDPQAKLISNGVASRQLGYYIDTKNQRWKVNDVWFIV